MGDAWNDILYLGTAMVLVAVLFVLLPALVYVCVKLGTYAYFRGKGLYKQDEEKRDGDAEGTGATAGRQRRP